MKPRLVKVSDRIRDDTPPGIERHEAFHTSTMWAGVAVNAPHLGTPWHHHGEHESAIYVTRGRIVIESGPAGADVIEASAGDFVHVPPRVVHRERNLTDDPAEVILVRAGSGAVMVTVSGPEPSER